MTLFEKISEKNEKMSVIGLGYVGIPLAVAFSKKVDVIGFDISEKKINIFKSGCDPTKEIGDEAIKNCTIDFTCDETRLREAKFHIVAVPTPVRSDNIPDLSFVENASSIIGRNLAKGSVVVYESTVYPGVTEDICVPILECASKLKCGIDFKIGYSPERINPGDREHRLENIVKVVAGMDDETLDVIAKVYSMIINAGVFKAENIKVAEAAKVIENSQRDINIAFMNELSMIFNKMDIDMKAVLEAASSKWNFLRFYPGLVGGHCIGVDPYYLTYKANQLGYRSQVILSGRRINDEMGKYVTNALIKLLIKSNVVIKGARVAILGLTFKENCPDARNTRIIDIVHELDEYGVTSIVSDPVCDTDGALEYGVKLVDMKDINNVDAVIFAVAHECYKKLNIADINRLFNGNKNDSKILIDVKGIFDRKEYTAAGYTYWRL
jgi:UDP-N-acetyl-D-galactosamine dehydrogenase